MQKNSVAVLCISVICYNVICSKMTIGCNQTYFNGSSLGFEFLARTKMDPAFKNSLEMFSPNEMKRTTKTKDKLLHLGLENKHNPQHMMGQQRGEAGRPARWGKERRG